MATKAELNTLLERMKSEIAILRSLVSHLRRKGRAQGMPYEDATARRVEKMERKVRQIQGGINFYLHLVECVSMDRNLVLSITLQK